MNKRLSVDKSGQFFPVCESGVYFFNELCTSGDLPPAGAIRVIATFNDFPLQNKYLSNFKVLRR